MAKDSGTILIVAGIAGLGFAWYKGYLAQFGFPAPSMASGSGLTPAQQAALILAAQQAAGSTGTSATTAAVVPALGTMVTNSSDALRQAAANDAFIIPDSATFTVLQSAPPSGYGWLMTTDKGGVLLRADVLAAVQTIIQNRVKRAADAGAAASSIQQAGNIALAEIQQIMSTQGLSGVQDFMRHMMTRGGMSGYRVM